MRSLWASALLATLLTVTAQALESAAVFFGRPITSIEFVGARDATLLAQALPFQPGDALTRRTLAEGLRALQTLGTYGGAAAHAYEDGEGVRVVLTLEPLRRIARVSLIGARSIDEKRLMRLADLPTGLEFTPELVDQAAGRIAGEYFREGWRDAEVRWDAYPLGADGALVVDLSIAEGDPTTLVRIEFEGDTGLTPGERAAAMELRPGERLSLVKLEQGLESLRERYRERAFFNARVRSPVIDVADKRAVVLLGLESGPRFTLQVRGNRAFDDKTLLAQTGYRGQKPLDEPTLRELARRLKSFYEFGGFPFARVEARLSHPPDRPAHADQTTRSHADRSVDPWGPQLAAPRPQTQETAAGGDALVTFLVREGTPVRVTDRSFEGLARFTEAELLARVDAVLRDAAPGALALGRDPAVLKAAWISGAPGDDPPPRRDVSPEEVFAPDVYQDACAQIASLYRSQGHLDAVVGPARLLPRLDGTARVVIPIAEGPQTIVSAVAYEGVSQVPLQDLTRVVALRAGDPLSFFAVEEARQSLVSAYQSRGFLYAQVEDAEHIDETTALAQVRFIVSEGERVRVSRVDVRGLVRTDRALVEHVVTLRPGDVATPQAMQESVRELLELGLFSSASVDVADPEQAAADKALVVDLREKPSRRLELRAGASRADGPRASGLLEWGNLAGRNETFLISGKFNWPFPRLCAWNPESCNSSALPDVPIERRINLSLILPSYAGFRLVPADMRIDAVHENLLRPAFYLQRYAGVVSFDRLLAERVGEAEVSAGIQVEVERDTFERRQTASAGAVQTLADFRAQLLPEGRILLVSVRPGFTFDWRDDKINPMSGLVASLTFDASRSLSTSLDQPGDTIQLLRTLVTASGWIPLSRKHRIVIALGGRAGSIIKADDSVVIGTKRFFLGGNQSLRGFNEDNVVPEDVRQGLHEAVERCRALASGLGCSDDIRDLLEGASTTSEGGEVFVAGRLELRFGLMSGVDGAVFGDAGNLWLDPAKFDPLNLRSTAGTGVRVATPIGPAAIDVAWNLTRDTSINEPLVQVHFSVGAF